MITETSKLMYLARTIFPMFPACCTRHFTSSSSVNRESWMGKRTKLRIRSEGTEGEKLLDVHAKMEQSCSFPDENLPNLLIGDQRFMDIPILHVKATKNNTLMTITTAHEHPQTKKLNILCQRTCGMDGFKHCRKGTNIAAQTTGFNLGKVAIEKGINSVRAIVRGLGPGRMASVKGMEMSGMKIVSLSDGTDTPNPKFRPRKARRV